MKTKLYKLIICLFIFSLCIEFTFAAAGDTRTASPDDFFADYVSRVWTAADGLPGNTITDVIQDKTGYLYIGTYDGLVRFDGVEFTIFNHTTNADYNFVSARTLFQDSKANIWVGTNDEGIVKIMPNGSVRQFTTSNGLSSNSVRSIAEDKDNNIWIGTAGGVSYITEDEKIVNPLGLEKYEDSQALILCLYCDSAGRIWVASSKENGIYYYTNGKFSRYDGITSIENPVVTEIAQDNTGAFWFGVSPHYAVRIDEGKQTVVDLAYGEQPCTIVNSIYQDRNHIIWFGTDSGVCILNGGHLDYYTQESGLADNNVNKILEDREGNIWFATDRGGLEKISIGRFKTISLPTTINAIAEDTNTGLIWLGADNGLYCYNNMMRVENDITKYCSNVRIRHVEIAKNGDLLVSTYAKFGMLRISPDGTIKSWMQKDGLTGDRVRVSLEANNGDLYIGTTNGLNVIDSETGAITCLTREQGLPNEYIMCLYEDKDGKIWCGTDGGGIFVLNNGKIENLYSTKNGLAGNVVFKIEEYEGELWICTGTGLSRLKDGSFYTFNYANGMGTDSVFQVLVDFTGTVWFTSNRGISSVKYKSLENVADGNSSHITAKFFSRPDGLRSGGVTSTSLSMKDSLGRLWFTLIDGFAVYDPVKVKSNMTVPVVHLQTITTDTETVAFNGQKIVLPPGNKRLSIKYTGLSFISTEMTQFSSQLLGFDSTYSDWSTARTVSYTNLKPGKYSFTVKAENSDEVESLLSQELYIEQKPYFYQMIVFWIVLVAFIIIAVGLGVKIRFSRMKKIQAQLETMVEKKTEDLEHEKDNSEKLLLNILPPAIAKRLSNNKNEVIADHYNNVSVLFADIVSFTKITSGLDASTIVNRLNDLFSRFDERAQKEGIEKIKTIGDAYMAASGLTVKNENPSLHLILFAKGMLADLDDFNKTSNVKFTMRIGINSGEVVAGVIGKSKFIYDVWGDTVNVASRMESSGVPQKIHVTKETMELSKNLIHFGEEVTVEVKGKGEMITYFVS
ncbi:MAG: adenylate/guanylate cyclase domain-containing protein [Treponema sp.]